MGETRLRMPSEVFGFSTGFTRATAETQVHLAQKEGMIPLFFFPRCVEEVLGKLEAIFLV